MEWINIFVIGVGLASFVTNGILLCILLRDPLRCFKASTTYFIISLSVSDLLTGTNACFWGITAEYLILSPDQQGYLLSLFWITTQVSFLTLLAMSVERFLIVKYPIYCRFWITKKRVSFAVACIWCVSMTLGGLILLPPPHLNYVQFSIFCEFFVSVFVIAGLYSFILFGIKRSQKSVQGTGQLHKGGQSTLRQMSPIREKCSVRRKDTYETQITVPEEQNSTLTNTLIPIRPKSSRITTNETTNNGVDLLNGNKTLATSNSGGTNFREEKNPAGAKTRMEFTEDMTNTAGEDRKDFINAEQCAVKVKDKVRRSQQDKLTVVVLLLVGILTLTVLPYLLASQILLGYSIFCECSPPEILTQFVFYYFPVELLNFAVNPLVYAWRLPQYRRSLKFLFSGHQANTEASVGWSSFRSRSVGVSRDSKKD